MSVLTLAGTAPLLRGGVSPVSWAPDAIDLRELEWATPFDIAALAVLWTRLAEDDRAPALQLPDDPSVRAYLVDAGLAGIIPGRWGVKGASSIDPPLIRLTRLHAPEDWDDATSELMADAHGAFSNRELVLHTFGILSELIDNAATHGRSPAGTFVFAQRYTGATSGLEPGIWLGIADGGRGIPSHLRLNPKYKGIENDEELIRLARQPWVTGTRDRRGWGLVEVFEDAAAVGPSEVLIRSGSGMGRFWLKAAATPRARYQGGLRPAVPGAWVHIRIEG
jgi:hypothetical protein